ncbi:MAG: ATP-binding protein [Chloroflexota bacterium]|nr:ATP-binding protein [Chloroflexota bacterium]
MSRILRVGTTIWPDDPFWVQVREAIEQEAQQRSVELVSIFRENAHLRSDEEELSFAEEVLAQGLDALIGWDLYERQAGHLLEAGLPIIFLSETHLRHPRLVSPVGLHSIGVFGGTYLAEQLDHRGRVLAVGGLRSNGEDGRSRLAGIREALASYPEMHLHHIPSTWRYEQAYPQIMAGLRELGARIDAIFGFSDSLALAARDAGRELGIVNERTPIVGVNGDPLALAAIAAGGMTATIRTSAADFGSKALNLAVQAARGLPLEPHFSYQPELVTAENVAEVAAQQLIAMASLPSRLVGFSRRQQQQRLVQLETSLEINRRAGLILEREHLSHAIADLIRANYGYDEVQLFLWDSKAQALVLEQRDQQGDHRAVIAVDDSPVLRAALKGHQPVFIPDTRISQRFAPDPTYPDVRARVVVPIRLGEQITGLLDLHSYHSTHHTHHELVGLETLAGQLGIAMRNAELYQEAVQARTRAEKADQLKTRLLANVSHELRTPLNVILGYSQAALESPNPYAIELPPMLRRDMQHIFRSGEHLIRLINDLLDLSRAEIDELELFPETITTHAFLEEVFHAIADQACAQGNVQWRLDVPERLPMLQADPVRLRQILLNLLHNAQKFTSSGEIVLGAEVMLPYLHLWVADTGRGIPIELQEHIFEPFATSRVNQRPEGIGLGLSITRRLIALHGGSMTLESQPNHGSTFHVYLPLPNLSGKPVSISDAQRPAVLLIDAEGKADDTITELCRREGLMLRCLRVGADTSALLADVQPIALAWNLAEANADDWIVFQHIRSQPQLAQLPMLFFAEAGSVPGTPASGMTNVLLKPLSGEKLLEAIDRLQPQAVTGSILIVDDDQDAHDLYRRLITRQLPGYTFRDAMDGREALEILEHETPSLVILDLMMPHVDGFAVLEQLRSAPRTRNVPVLVLSGHVLSAEEIQRLNRAHVTFHSKDILTEAETAEVVERALAQPDALPPQTSMLVKHALAYMQQNYASALSRQEIADAVGVNKDYLGRIFHRELGISPWDYLSRYRIKRAKELLRTTSASITTVAVEVGFDDAAYFSRVFSKEVGCSPREYRDRS